MVSHLKRTAQNSVLAKFVLLVSSGKPSGLLVFFMMIYSIAKIYL